MTSVKNSFFERWIKSNAISSFLDIHKTEGIDGTIMEKLRELAEKLNEELKIIRLFVLNYRNKLNAIHKFSTDWTKKSTINALTKEMEKIRGMVVQDEKAGSRAVRIELKAIKLIDELLRLDKSESERVLEKEIRIGLVSLRSQLGYFAQGLKDQVRFFEENKSLGLEAKHIPQLVRYLKTEANFLFGVRVRGLANANTIETLKQRINVIMARRERISRFHRLVERLARKRPVLAVVRESILTLLTAAVLANMGFGHTGSRYYINRLDANTKKTILSISAKPTSFAEKVENINRIMKARGCPEVNPITPTKEISDYARALTRGLKSDLGKAIVVFISFHSSPTQGITVNFNKPAEGISAAVRKLGGLSSIPFRTNKGIVLTLKLGRDPPFTSFSVQAKGLDFRFLEVSRADPQTAAEVYESLEGDCLETAYLYVSLLQSLGIDADVTFVKSSSNLYDHAIIRVMVDGKEYYVDVSANVFGMRIPASMQPDLKGAEAGLIQNHLEQEIVRRMGKKYYAELAYYIELYIKLFPNLKKGLMDHISKNLSEEELKGLSQEIDKLM